MPTIMNESDCTKCCWHQTEEGQWESDCSNVFEFTEGAPLENGFEWCPYCGKALAEILLEGDRSEDQRGPGSGQVPMSRGAA